MAKTPIRTCVACRTTGDKAGLIRVVKSSTGEVTVDPSGRKAGRGAYVCRKPECVTAAFKRKGFDRALRTAVPADFQNILMDAVLDNENTSR